MKRILLISIAALALSGCMTGNAKRFFAENKSYSFKKVNLTLATPWGTETISADEMTSTVMYPYGATNTPTVIVTNLQFVPFASTNTITLTNGK